MSLAYPSQRLQDRLSQQWNIWRGHRIASPDATWLMGPIGDIDSTVDDFIASLANNARLVVERDVKSGGLLTSIGDLELPASERERLASDIVDFYESTAQYSLDVRVEWSSIYRIFGGLLCWIYSDRLKQLNIPATVREESGVIRSEVIKVRDTSNGQVAFTVWHRTLVPSGRVLYFGIYSTCRLPSGKVCIKVIFPLPRGNATVILEPTVGSSGELLLTSHGKKYGDPGFYFIVKDAEGNHWAQYISSFREYLRVFVDEHRRLQADHVVSLWGSRVLRVHFGMSRFESTRRELKLHDPTRNSSSMMGMA